MLETSRPPPIPVNSENFVNCFMDKLLRTSADRGVSLSPVHVEMLRHCAKHSYEVHVGLAKSSSSSMSSLSMSSLHHQSSVSSFATMSTNSTTISGPGIPPLVYYPPTTNDRQPDVPRPRLTNQNLLPGRNSLPTQNSAPPETVSFNISPVRTNDYTNHNPTVLRHGSNQAASQTLAPDTGQGLPDAMVTAWNETSAGPYGWWTEGMASSPTFEFDGQGFPPTTGFPPITDGLENQDRGEVPARDLGT
jgi:hypothetical protein